MNTTATKRTTKERIAKERTAKGRTAKGRTAKERIAKDMSCNRYHDYNKKTHVILLYINSM